MAIGNNELQVVWSSVNYKDLTSGTPTATSDQFTFSTAAYAGMITLKADNQGTPASGDTVEFYALLSCGDPDGSASAEFPNDDSDGIFLAILDTNADDPAIATVKIPVEARYGRLYAKSGATSNTIRVSACINEKTNT